LMISGRRLVAAGLTASLRRDWTVAEREKTIARDDDRVVAGRANAGKVRPSHGFGN
jgi:hypothetical protein